MSLSPLCLSLYHGPWYIANVSISLSVSLYQCSWYIANVSISLSVSLYQCPWYIANVSIFSLSLSTMVPDISLMSLSPLCLSALSLYQCPWYILNVSIFSLSLFNIKSPLIFLLSFRLCICNLRVYISYNSRDEYSAQQAGTGILCIYTVIHPCEVITGRQWGWYESIISESSR